MTRKTTKRISTTIILCLLMTALFSGCASEATTSPKEDVKAPTEKVAETIVEDKEEVVEETMEKTEQESLEEMSPQSVFEWSQSVNASEPILTIWNDITKEGYIVENGQKCVLKEGDALVVCMQEAETNIQFLSPVKCNSYGSEIYKVLEFEQEFSEDTLYEFTMTIAGVEYPFSVTLISENATAAIDDSESSTEMSAMEWTTTLEYEEPKLVAWNDETGTREVIENGGQYKMQEGDTLAVYYPEGYVVYFVTPYEFVETLNFVAIDLIVLEYKLPAESQNINLKVEFCDSADVDSAFNYVITTP